MKQSLEFSLDNLSVEQSYLDNVSIEKINVKIEMEASEQEYIKLMDYVFAVAQAVDKAMGRAGLNITFDAKPAEETAQPEDTSEQA